MSHHYKHIHASVLKRFECLKGQDKLAHAYLFTGPKLIGKYHTAMAAARLINEEISFKQCENASEEMFERILKPHPDIMVVDKEYGETIKIEDVRDIIQHVKLRPFSAEKKIFILTNIDGLTTQAANALLKTLEEPSPSSMLILTTSALDGVLDTIKSRCHIMKFFTQGTDTLAADLMSQHRADEAEARCLAFFSEGCAGRAAELLSDKFYDRKNYLIDEFLFAPKVDQFIKQITADKSRLKEFLDIMMSWVRDCILVKSGRGLTGLVHFDRAKEVEHFCRKFTFKELVRLYKEIIAAHKQLAENLNLKIPLLTIREFCYV